MLQANSGPTTPLQILSYIQTKTGFLGPFKKPFFLMKKSKIVLMASFTLLPMPIGVSLDYFSFCHYLATSCYLYRKRLSSLKSALKFPSNKPIFCRISVLVWSCAANQYSEVTCIFSKFLKNSACSKG